MEFAQRGLIYAPQVELPLSYKGRPLTQRYIPDFVLFDKIVVEIKAISELADIHRAQVHNYLKATKFRLGILVNFGSHPQVEYERIVN